MLIQWRKVFETGIPRIDEQHRHMVDIINRVEQTRARGESRKELVEAFKEIVEYTKYHFEDEEKVQEEIGFEGLAEHRVLHRNLVRDVADMLERMRDREAIHSRELLAFLMDWLSDHILKEDRKLSPVYEAWKAKQTQARINERANRT